MPKQRYISVSFADGGMYVIDTVNHRIVLQTDSEPKPVVPVTEHFIAIHESQFTDFKRFLKFEDSLPSRSKRKK